jgi:hypothetical protein
LEKIHKLSDEARGSISSFCINKCPSFCCRKGYLTLSRKEEAFKEDYIEESKLSKIHSQIPIDNPIFQFLSHESLKYNPINEELNSLYNFGYLDLDIFRAKGHKKNELDFPLKK